MRYCHRTPVSPDRVLAAANGFFAGRLAPSEEAPRRRTFSGSLGRLSVAARAEGGHYTFVEVTTDQVGESEIDRLAKRFLAEVHQLAIPAYELRGAY